MVMLPRWSLRPSRFTAYLDQDFLSQLTNMLSASSSDYEIFGIGGKFLSPSSTKGTSLVRAAWTSWWRIGLSSNSRRSNSSPPIHWVQVRSYLKATGCALGLLINFNVPVLLRGVQRVILTS